MNLKIQHSKSLNPKPLNSNTPNTPKNTKIPKILGFQFHKNSKLFQVNQNSFEMYEVHS